MTPEFLSSVKMNYPCGYEYLVGQQQPLHNIQLIYPAAAASGQRVHQWSGDHIR